MSPPRPPLTLLATTDLHGARVPEVATLAAEARAAGHGVVLVDNGDAVGGPAGLQVSESGGPCGLVRWFHGLGLTAASVGNHDFDGGVDALRARAAQARFSFLAANLRVGGAPVLPASVEVETAAGRVGITGALSALSWWLWAPSLRGAIELDDPVEALVDQCRLLRPRCDFVVALAHLGQGDSSVFTPPGAPTENPSAELLLALGAAGGPGDPRPLADCVVLGHSHDRRADVIRNDDGGATVVLLPGAYGATVGRAVITAGASNTWRAELVDVAADGDLVARSSAADPALAKRLTAERAEQADLLAEPLVVGAHEDLAGQLLGAARAQGADGLVLAHRADPAGPPVHTVGEALGRLPMLEPLVLMELTASDHEALLGRRAEHRAAGLRSRDPFCIRRHEFHDFALLGRSQAPGGERQRLLVPAAWSGGYGGYAALGQARVLAEPVAHLVELLRRGAD